jgi:hypothetical protein
MPTSLASKKAVSLRTCSGAGGRAVDDGASGHCRWRPLEPAGTAHANGRGAAACRRACGKGPAHCGHELGSGRGAGRHGAHQALKQPRAQPLDEVLVQPAEEAPPDGGQQAVADRARLRRGRGTSALVRPPAMGKGPTRVVAGSQAGAWRGRRGGGRPHQQELDAGLERCLPLAHRVQRAGDGQRDGQLAGSGSHLRPGPAASRRSAPGAGGWGRRWGGWRPLGASDEPQGSRHL